jgi:hypothetical protein
MVKVKASDLVKALKSLKPETEIDIDDFTKSLSEALLSNLKEIIKDDECPALFKQLMVDSGLLNLLEEMNSLVQSATEETVN